MKKVVLGVILGWLVLITVLHLHLNLGVRFANQGEAQAERRLRIGYLPVTCHLTCPVTDFITRASKGGSIFKPVRFSGWPELKETFLAGQTEATFILAPLAISLRESGVPIKIVYLGHRDGTALVARKGAGIVSIPQLRGRKIAVPNRFSNQYLLLFRALRDHGIGLDDITLVELPPPDMPAALYAGAVDAITSGEPYMGQAELDGYGQVLFLTKDVWPNFISCVLAIREDVIEKDRASVQKLVEGIARSGKWLDSSMDNRMAAAQFVAEKYYNQDPRLLRFVLSKPPDRVKYTDLRLNRPQFEEIERLGQAAGILKGTAHFLDYADTSFVRSDQESLPWDWRAAK